MPDSDCRLFFAADIHGSELCFRKWLNAAKVYRPDVLIFGGDIAGKVLVPIVRCGAERHVANVRGRRIETTDREGLIALRELIRANGSYQVVLDPDVKAAYDADPARVEREVFPQVVRESVASWITLAEERLAALDVPAFMVLGNDDYPELASILQGNFVRNVEGSVVELPGGFEMISLGYSNRTPWHSPRELSEEKLAARIAPMADSLKAPHRAIFNIHCPPYGTVLDVAPRLDENFRPLREGGQIKIGSVGSTAVRQAIEQYQPMLTLHGHIHESPGTYRLGRTLCINPGSDYGNGVLCGVLVVLSQKNGVRSWQLIQG